MPNWRFWESRSDAGNSASDRHLAHPSPTDESSQPRTAPVGTTPPVRPPGSALSPERRARRIADLEQRRDGLLYDIEQGELAAAPDNPWAERISLLRESLETITTDRERLENLPPDPTWVVPDVPIADVAVTTGEPATVSFVIAGVAFRYAEATDWDNRGGMIVRGDLRLGSGNPADLPFMDDAAVPEPFVDRITEALTVYAVTLRDAALEDDAPSTNNNLRDVIREDDEVGGWRNMHGTNPIRVQRAYERQALRAERDRIDAEIAAEEEQRRTLVDRLPIARKRLAGVLEDLERLGAGSAT